MRTAVEGGNYALGLALYPTLAAPSPTDARYMGICLHNEGRYAEAELYLSQAVQRGDLAAYIYLASVHISCAQTPEALACLDRVSPDDLPPQEAALWLRERARTGWMLGEPRTQLLAWGSAAWQVSAPAATTVQVSVATFLASLYEHFGEPERALPYLHFAAEHGHARRQEYAAQCLAEAYVALRRFDEAEAALHRIHSPELRAMSALTRVRILRLRGQWREATAALHALLPGAAQTGAVEFQARVALLSLATLAGEDRDARRHWRRAEELAPTPYYGALIQHRAGQFLARQGDARAPELLRAAEVTFRAADRPLERVAIHLALAEVLPSERAAHLTAAAEIAASLSTLPDLTLEWPFVPAVRAHLDALPADAFERLLLHGLPEPEATLRSLGSGTLWVGGQRVTFRFARTVELLSYLRRQGEVSLADVQRDLFPEVSPARSKNYFHQVRVDLATRVPGLEIVYDTGRKTYSLGGRLALKWDVEALEQGLTDDPLRTLQAGWQDLLTASEGEWVQTERDRLRHLATQRGLETLEAWLQSGDSDRCVRLAEALLPIEPLDEALHAMLLRATYHARGRLPALRRYQQSARVFRQDVGEVPETLQTLERGWRALN